MNSYKAPLRDINFLLTDVFNAGALWASFPKLEGSLDEAIAGAVLEEIGGLGRMLGPFSDLPELTSVEWPRYGTWEEEAARASQKHLSTVWSSTPLAAKLARL